MNMKVKRRQLLVNKRLQSFFALQIALFFTFCLCIMAIDYFILTELSNARSLAFSDPIRQDPSIFDITIGYAMMLFALNGAFFYLLSVIFSHRIAGPMMNITRSLNAIHTGDLSTMIHLRKADYLKEIEGNINQVTTGFRQTVNTLNEVINELDDSDEKQKLQAILQHYKTE